MNVLLEYIKEHQAGLILVTHDENIAKLCNRRYRLHEKHLEEF